MTDMDEIREEHADVVIGELIADLLAQTAQATAPFYPPDEYSPAGVWNAAAIDDVTQDWVVTRLLERGDLGLMIRVARDVRTLKALLARSLRQHLINRRRRTSATNLYSRMIKMLRDDAGFSLIGSSASPALERWTLADRPETDPAGHDVVSRLIKVAYARTDTELGVVRYGPYSLKSSPILRERQLRSFLAHLLAEAGGSVTTTDLFQVMRHRFNLIELPPPVLDECQPDTQPSVSSKVEARVLARGVLAQLGAGTAALIKAVDDAEGDHVAAARTLQVPPSTTAEAQDHLQALIAEYAESEEDARAIYRELIESLYGDGETND